MDNFTPTYSKDDFIKELLKEVIKLKDRFNLLETKCRYYDMKFKYIIDCFEIIASGLEKYSIK